MPPRHWSRHKVRVSKKHVFCPSGIWMSRFDNPPRGSRIAPLIFELLLFQSSAIRASMTTIPGFPRRDFNSSFVILGTSVSDTTTCGHPANKKILRKKTPCHFVSSSFLSPLAIFGYFRFATPSVVIPKGRRNHRGNTNLVVSQC